MVPFKRFSRNAGMLSVLWCLAVAVAAAAAGTGIKTKPGELVIDPPTLINLGFEWLIEGDDNRNASVEVSYRARARASGNRDCRCCGCRANESFRRRACST